MAATNSRKNYKKNIKEKKTGGELICKSFGVNGIGFIPRCRFSDACTRVLYSGIRYWGPENLLLDFSAPTQMPWQRCTARLPMWVWAGVVYVRTSVSGPPNVTAYDSPFGEGGDVINQSIVTVAQRTFVCHARFQCPSGQQHLVSTGLTGYSGCRLVRWWNARMWSAWASSNRSEEPKWIDSKEPKRTDSEDRRVTAGSGL